MVVQGMSTEKRFDRITQSQVDQTAPAVYEAAKRAAEADNSVYRSALLHEEDLHVNLGRTLETIPEVNEERQWRRPGGGDYIIHDGSEGSGTYCFIDARVKNGPKEMTGLQRERMAFQTLNALADVYDEVGVLENSSYIEKLNGESVIESGVDAAYYDPEEGDIYLQQGLMPRYDDPQIAGIGLAEVEVDDEWVQVGRVCMYPNAPTDEAVELDRQIRDTENELRDLDKRIEPVDELEKVADSLEPGKSREIRAEQFLSGWSKEKGRQLQQKNGSRPADPCF